MRYWSICNNVMSPPYPVIANTKPGGGKTYGCMDDNQAVFNSKTDRRVTLVISRPYLRPATAKNW